MLWSISRRLPCLICLITVASLVANLVANPHKITLHGRVSLTIANLRQEWLTKRVIEGCNRCKRFQAIDFVHPPTGKQPRDRTEGSSPFQVIGVNYADPIKYRTKGKGERKAYIVLYACSLTRGLYRELLPDLSTEEFLASLKRLVAKRGRSIPTMEEPLLQRQSG